MGGMVKKVRLSTEEGGGSEGVDERSFICY